MQDTLVLSLLAFTALTALSSADEQQPFDEGRSIYNALWKFSQARSVIQPPRHTLRRNWAIFGVSPRSREIAVRKYPAEPPVHRAQHENDRSEKSFNITALQNSSTDIPKRHIVNDAISKLTKEELLPIKPDNRMKQHNVQVSTSVSVSSSHVVSTFSVESGKPFSLADSTASYANDMSEIEDKSARASAISQKEPTIASDQLSMNDKTSVSPLNEITLHRTSEIDKANVTAAINATVAHDKTLNGSALGNLTQIPGDKPTARTQMQKGTLIFHLGEGVSHELGQLVQDNIISAIAESIGDKVHQVTPLSYVPTLHVEGSGSDAADQLFGDSASDEGSSETHSQSLQYVSVHF